MDDLKHQVGELGRRMDEGFAEQRREMKALLDKVDERFEKVDERLIRTQEMVVGIHATVTRFALALLGVVSAQVVLLLTQV